MPSREEAEVEPPRDGVVKNLQRRKHSWKVAESKDEVVNIEVAEVTFPLKEAPEVKCNIQIKEEER